MDNAQKVATFRAALGGDGVDQEFAQQVLEVHGWDLQAALAEVLGGDVDMRAMEDFAQAAAGPHAGAPVPAAAPAAVQAAAPAVAPVAAAAPAAAAVPAAAVPAAAPPPRPAAPAPAEAAEAEGYRAPMRTGYMDTLLDPRGPERDRREEERREQEARELKAKQAEERRLAEERARHEDNARFVEQQRLEAEQLARDRQTASPSSGSRPAAYRQLFAMSDDMDEDDEPEEPQRREFLGGSFLGSGQRYDEAAERAAQELREGRPPEQKRLSGLERQMEANAAAEAARRQEQEVSARERLEAAPRVQDGGASSSAAAPKAVHAVVQACVALRRQHKDSNLAGLVSCLETVRLYVDNLAQNPQEPKFQRINRDNSSFKSRVASLEGGEDVLKACGFREAEGGSALVVDGARANGVKLREALSKIDVAIEQLQKSAG